MNNMDILLAALNKEKKRRAQMAEKFDWEILARPEQKMPEGNWFGWFIMAGRGFGKTRTGAETIKQLIMSGQYKRICLLGETYDQVRSIMIEGESGLMNIHTKEEMPTFRASKRELIWPNGAIATCFSSENYQALRGPQFDLAWVDELAKFDNAEEVWDQLMFCLRLGSAPKVIITTTPRPRKIICELMNRKDIHITKGTTFDNAKNLAPNFLKMLENQYVNTKIAKQEIEGELITLDSSALWHQKDIEYCEVNLKNLEIIIAIDPAITANENSDETGIIVVGKDADNYYILEDQSGTMKPEIWAYKAQELYEKYNAQEIIIETNQGGDILMAMLKSIANIPWKGVRARDNKYKRAQPIASLYQQKKVKHIKKFEQLEEQMLKAHINFRDDRLDALVWGIFALMQSKTESKIETNFASWSY